MWLLPQDVLFWKFVGDGNACLWTRAYHFMKKEFFLRTLSGESVFLPSAVDWDLMIYLLLSLSPGDFRPQKLYLCNLTQLQISSISALGSIVRSCSIILFWSSPLIVHLFNSVLLCNHFLPLKDVCALGVALLFITSSTSTGQFLNKPYFDHLKKKKRIFTHLVFSQVCIITTRNCWCETIKLVPVHPFEISRHIEFTCVQLKRHMILILAPLSSEGSRSLRENFHK